MLLTSGDVQYIYDSNGNLVSKNDSGKITEYKYDTRNLLTEVDNPNTSYVKYGYDALGRKVYRQEAQADMDKLETLYGSNNGNNNSNGNSNENSNGNGNSNGNENSGNSGDSNGNGNNGIGGNGNNAGGNGNGYGKYDNPGQGNKYGIYKNGSGDIEIPLTIEAERYQYLGLTTLVNKEYSDKGAPYAEYHIANNQVISQKMFGLHGLVTPGKEDTLNTNGGLMYYQYDGAGSVTELTNRQGEEIEHYRYDAFGNIFTGITSPYNTTVYTGQDYDDLAGLVQMDARWYAPNLGRFTSQDLYAGDTYNPQSLNRYSYVMNNPVNMWDPTGHVPEWVGQQYHIEYSSDRTLMDLYDLINSSNSSSDWVLSGQTETDNQITYQYTVTVNNSWVYYHYYLRLSELQEGVYNVYDGPYSETYSQTNYYSKEVIKTAAEMAGENQQYINNLAGDPPKDTDPPTVGIGTLQINNDQLQVTDFEVNETKINITQSLTDFQKSYGITESGVVDEETLQQLGSIYRHNNVSITKDEIDNDSNIIKSFSVDPYSFSNSSKVNNLDQAYSIMTDYINGKDVLTDKLKSAIDYASNHGKITSVNSLNTSVKTDKNDYNRYDTEILAWTNYWNYLLKDTEGFDVIDANYVKAIMYVESKMGYAPEEKNSKNDVMQSLFPGDPSFWTQSRINSGTFYGLYHTITNKSTYIDTDGDGDKEYITKYFINTILTNGKETTASLYAPSNYLNKDGGGTSVDGKYYGIPESGYGLLKTVIEEGTYNYNNITPTMSIAFGVRWYEYRKRGKQEIEGIKAYNGGGDLNYENEIRAALGFMGINTKGLQ